MIRHNLYYGIQNQNVGGVDGRGNFEIAVEDLAFNHNQPRQFPVEAFSQESLAWMETYEGLGDFEKHPDIAVIEARIAELK